MYLVTYPNGKIYIGKDLTDTPSYFGSVNPDLLRADFTTSDLDDFTVRKKVLWASVDCADAEVSRKEVEMIKKYGSNDPAVGYNRWPKWKEK